MGKKGAEFFRQYTEDRRNEVRQASKEGKVSKEQLNKLEKRWKDDDFKAKRKDKYGIYK